MSYIETPTGDYSLTVTDNVATLTFLRTDQDKMFKLSDILKANGLTATGKFVVVQQFYYAKVEETETVGLANNFVHKMFLKFLSEPTEKDIVRTNTKRFDGPTPNPIVGKLDYAYTKVTVPVK